MKWVDKLKAIHKRNTDEYAKILNKCGPEVGMRATLYSTGKYTLMLFGWLLLFIATFLLTHWVETTHGYVWQFWALLPLLTATLYSTSRRLLNSTYSVVFLVTAWRKYRKHKEEEK